MPKLVYTKGNIPTSEQFRKDLDAAFAASNPIDNLLETVHDLLEFEAKYNMPSDEFYRKFQAGQMGDAFEFFEWSALYRMYTTTRRSIELALMRDAVKMDTTAATPAFVEQSEAVPA